MHRRTPRSAFTLTELMVALSIIAIALGIGMAMIGRSDKNMGLRAATGQVIAAVRFARSAAIAERSPSYVVLDPEDRTVSHISKKTMGLWHLEDETTTGALGRNGAVTGGQLIPGKVGQAWYSAGQGSIDCGNMPLFAPEQGLVLECWAYVEDRSPQTLIGKGEDYGLRITKEGYLEAFVAERRISTSPEVIPLKKWFYVEAILTTPLPPPPAAPAEEPDPAAKDEEKGKDAKDKKDAKDEKEEKKGGSSFEKESKTSAPTEAPRQRTFVLYVNDQLIAYADVPGAEMATLPRGPARLTLSSLEEPLKGALDEVRVSALVEGERYRLPDKVDLESGAATLRFDATGRLGGPAEIRLKSGTESQVLRVGVLGNIE